MSAIVEKELSWLAFDARVLQEAENPDTPLVHRVRFLGIYSSNQDEFYNVRVADVRCLAGVTSGGKKEHFDGLLNHIHSRVIEMQRRFDACYKQIMGDLVDETQLTDEQQKFVVRYFNDEVLNYLDPFLSMKATSYQT